MNMVNIIKIDKNSKDLNTIRKIYMDSFPKEERPPFFILKSKINNPGVDLFSIYYKDILVGFFYSLTIEKYKLTYLFFFAIKKEYQGMKIGTKALDKFTSYFKDNRIFLAMEEINNNTDNYLERISRMNFYLKNGFHLLNQKLIEKNVIYDLLGTSNKVQAFEYKELLETNFNKSFIKYLNTKIIEN